MIVSVESPSQGPEILERVFAALREVCGFADIDVPRYLEANPNWVYELFGERKGKYGDDAETEVA